MEKEQLNQTTTNEAVEAKDEKVNIADIRQKIEQRYNDKLTKAQVEFTAQLEAANKELEFYKNQLPQLEQAYTKAGGNKEFFNDWLKLNKDSLDYQDLDKSIKTSFETNKWAKANNGFSVNKTLNTSINLKPSYDDDDYYEGTVYKKIK